MCVLTEFRSLLLPGQKLPDRPDVAFGKPEVMLLSWMREVPESLPAPGVAGAVLTKVAFRSSRKINAIVSRIVMKATVVC